jgi:hypothetical protein
MGVLHMTGKLMIAVLGMAWLGSAVTIDISTAPSDPAGVYLAQEAGGPPRTGQPPPEAPGSPARGKAPADKSKEERPAAPPKGDPLKPFEPTEKVKADQAIDFPADI